MCNQKTFSGRDSRPTTAARCRLISITHSLTGPPAPPLPPTALIKPVLQTWSRREARRWDHRKTLHVIRLFTSNPRITFCRLFLSDIVTLWFKVQWFHLLRFTAQRTTWQKALSQISYLLIILLILIPIVLFTKNKHTNIFQSSN